MPSVIFNIDTVYTDIAGQPINGIDVSSAPFTAIALTALVLLMALHQPRAPDARRRGESALSRARRVNALRVGAIAGPSLAYWQVSPAFACPAVFPTSGPGLHHLDGGCHRRSAAWAVLRSMADRRRSWDLDGDP